MKEVKAREKVAFIEKAWLVYWEGAKREDNENLNNLISVIDSNKTAKEIASFIAEYWVADIKKDDIKGMISTAKMDNNSFILHTQLHIIDNERVVCGYDGNYIKALLCSDIKYFDNNDLEYINNFGNKYKNFELKDE